MINGIIIVVLIVVAIFAVKGTMHQFVYGCCGSKDVEKKIKVQDKNTSDYPYYAVVGVDGMKCKHCKLHVENAFNEKDGNWAEVNLEKKEADVRLDQVEQLADNRRNAAKMSRTAGTFQHGGKTGNINIGVGFCTVRVDLFYRRRKN